MADPKQSDLFRQESLERLSSPERLDELMQVASPRRWLPLGTVAVLFGVGLVWSVVGRIPVTAQGQGMLVQGEETTTSEAATVALLYFDGGYQGQIQPGMSVRLMPQTQQGLGGRFIPAAVETVGTRDPITLSAARTQIQAGEPQSNPVEVIATLSPATHSTSTPLASGMTVTGRLTLRQRAPISFLLPFLEVRSP